MAVLRVRDDGAGFDLEKAALAARAHGSVGLIQMRERAERAGGRFAIQTASGKGTQIQVELPMRGN
jgi:signal transduction histidine kinase